VFRYALVSRSQTTISALSFWWDEDDNLICRWGVQMLTKIRVTFQLIGASEFVRDDAVAYSNSV
jgi:hypothetical protein